MTRKIPSDAFDCYVSMGEGRSYEKVASKYGVSKRAITDCAKREKWAERLDNIEEESRRKSDEKLVEAIQEMRERHLRTIKAMNGRALEAMREYPLASGMEAMKAAEMAIKLERLIAGEPTERTASVEEITRREVQSLLVVEETDDGGEEDGADGDREENQ